MCHAIACHGKSETIKGRLIAADMEAGTITVIEQNGERVILNLDPHRIENLRMGRYVVIPTAPRTQMGD